MRGGGGHEDEDEDGEGEGQTLVEEGSQPSAWQAPTMGAAPPHSQMATASGTGGLGGGPAPRLCP